MNCLLLFIVFGSTYILNKCSRIKPLICCQWTVSEGQQWCRADVSRTDDADTSIVCGAPIANRFHNSVHQTQQCRYNSGVKLGCLLNQALLFREWCQCPYFIRLHSNIVYGFHLVYPWRTYICVHNNLF